MLSDLNSPDGVAPSYFPLENRIHGNFLINNYQSVWPIDHDDGSCFFHDTGNVLVYGGYKTYIGDHKTVRTNTHPASIAFTRSRHATLPQPFPTLAARAD